MSETRDIRPTVLPVAPVRRVRPPVRDGSEKRPFDDEMAAPRAPRRDGHGDGDPEPHPDPDEEGRGGHFDEYA